MHLVHAERFISYCNRMIQQILEEEAQFTIVDKMRWVLNIKQVSHQTWDCPESMTKSRLRRCSCEVSANRPEHNQIEIQMSLGHHLEYYSLKKGTLQFTKAFLQKL